MRAAMIGDNCIDFYRNIDGIQVNRMYPTGNCVDTGVNLQKLGIPTSIISTTGNDNFGKSMKEALHSEKLDLSHFKTGHGSTAITYMDLDGKDRVHGDYEEGVMESIVFDENDIEFTAKHDLIHSALWGMAHNVLPEIKKRTTGLISFDYADRLEHPLVEETLASVDIGFFSYGQKSRDEYIENYLIDKVNRGMKIAIATFGENGSLAYDGQFFYQFGIYPVEKIVNTVGAGDSFISGFLSGYLNGLSIEECLKLGAKISAEVIQVFEPWVIEEEEE
ncbi:MAG: fructoselysine 6-kinase [Enterococcus gilvus]